MAASQHRSVLPGTGRGTSEAGGGAFGCASPARRPPRQTLPPFIKIVFSRDLSDLPISHPRKSAISAHRDHRLRRPRHSLGPFGVLARTPSLFLPEFAMRNSRKDCELPKPRTQQNGAGDCSPTPCKALEILRINASRIPPPDSVPSSPDRGPHPASGCVRTWPWCHRPRHNRTGRARAGPALRRPAPFPEPFCPG
jgi:hypothetical protein